MSGNSKPAGLPSLSTKKDDGSRNAEQKPTAENPSDRPPRDIKSHFQHHVTASDRSVSTKKDDGSGNAEQKPAAENPSPPGDIKSHFQRHVTAPDVSPVASTQKKKENETPKDHFGSKVPSTSAVDDKTKRVGTSSTGVTMGRKNNKLSNANHSAPQTSDNSNKTTDSPGNYFSRQGSAKTRKSDVSGTTGEHSSEKDTGTGQLQSEKKFRRY